MAPNEQILKAIKRYSMTRPGDRVLVAVSGGPDSVFLLYSLKEMEKELGIRLAACHLDHSARGGESAADARFVRKISKKLKVPLISAKIKGKQPTKKISKEEWMREKRYAFFLNAARRMSSRVIATAHTMDDQAETVLMRIVKGTSIKGLVGIHPARREGNVMFIRPLMRVKKKEILEHLRKRNIPYRLDRTNAEEKFLRNRIRRKLMPYLLTYNPRVDRALCNLADNLREDFRFIEEEKKKRKNLLKGSAKSVSVSLSSMLLQPKVIQKEMLREAFIMTGANVKKLTYRHWGGIEDFILKKAKGKRLELPGGVTLHKSANELRFVRSRN